jgi:AcrR family transcriptional regulator
MHSPGSEKPLRESRKIARQEEQRQRLIEAGKALLHRQGIQGFSVAAIAAEAGIAKASFYYYFPSQEALVGSIAEGLLEGEAEAMLQAVNAAPDGIRGLSALLRCRVGRYKDDFPSFRLLYLWTEVLGLEEGAVARIAYPRAARVQGRLEERLREDAARGLLHPDVSPRELASVAWCTAQGLLALASGMAALGGELRFPIERLCEEAAKNLERGAERAPDIRV